MSPPATRSPEHFDAIMLSIASPEDILSWSHGEVTKPETVNYRTQRAEPDGLFCERIFGPTKNFQCFCGKYKGIRYSGVVCEKCGVEVTRSLVRRDRMGHINLAVPISHTWFLRSAPSRIGLLLDLPIKMLEQIVYFASYIVISTDQEYKKEAEKDLETEHESRRKQLRREFEEAKESLQKGNSSEEQIATLEEEYTSALDALKESHRKAIEELRSLDPGTAISELVYREMNMKFGHIFRAGTGAESIREILERLDLNKLLAEAQEERRKASGQKLKKIMKRIKLITSLLRANTKPEWMILTRLPVLPPDLRPMVQLDGGRFAASDLNDLYRRVINRNNRLKKLMSIGAPEVICRNEKRMLQEAVDALLNSSARSGKTLFTSGDRRKLRSLSDMLKGKQGRFRQNLLGKRVDYSGRSVIVSGPAIRLFECGIPKEMAMKLFKPFIIGKLISLELAHNVKGAERLILEGKREVWDILEDIIADKYVLLNRAPTLHRLGIQAFKPVLIEGLAIQLHPLVCTAFNADFDGDQMAVHVPLSKEAQQEVQSIIASTNNVLKPSTGEPIITPTQDMILGCHFLTSIFPGKRGEGMTFHAPDEAVLAHEEGFLHLQAKIQCMVNGLLHSTSVGRLLFNEIIPPELQYVNEPITKSVISNLISRCLELKGVEHTVEFADDIKDLGFRYATQSGISVAAADILVPVEKEEVLKKANEDIENITALYRKGWITAEERYSSAIRIWTDVKSTLTHMMTEDYKEQLDNDITIMVDSGARGNWGQIAQLAAMKGLVANPSGRTIELPITSNLKEGFSVLEYFIATHGGRKGKSDTALKTAEAGYLTRRLIDAVQDLLLREEDCGSTEEHSITRKESDEMGETFEKRLFGRTLARDLVLHPSRSAHHTEQQEEPGSGGILARRNDPIDSVLLQRITESGIDAVSVRSVLTCHTRNGICTRCYGYDLADNRPALIGAPVGVIAAQSIGEPGTQLTMRTFHMGGVAEGADITQGLTRVEELFEARTPRTPATLSDIAGQVTITHRGGKTVVEVQEEELGTDTYVIPTGFVLSVEEGKDIPERYILAKSALDRTTIRAVISGQVTKVSGNSVEVKHRELQRRTYTFDSRETLRVRSEDHVETGEALNAGHYNLYELLQKRGCYAVQKYIVKEVRQIYTSQGQDINEKHIEIVVRKMFSKVRVVESGDTTLLPGEVVDAGTLEHANEEIRKDPAKRPAIGEYLLLGLTRVALATESWLAGASFQETIRVLVEAATTQKVDTLDGLKENVIIGRLIPAGAVYRDTLLASHANHTTARPAAP
jgi:DNA-directed RNA polymerase subunit beta'